MALSQIEWETGIRTRGRGIAMKGFGRSSLSSGPLFSPLNKLIDLIFLLCLFGSFCECVMKETI